jgi:hypothetical protein
LDSYCLRTGIRPTVIKIDVETHEAQVLRGARDTLRFARPAVVCELLSSADEQATLEVLHMLKDLKYNIYRWGDAAVWTQCEVADVLSHTDESNRDWLFSPSLLDERFHRAVNEWLVAISECTEKTNLMVDPGTKPPSGWGAPYIATDRMPA